MPKTTNELLEQIRVALVCLVVLLTGLSIEQLWLLLHYTRLVIAP